MTAESPTDALLKLTGQLHRLRDQILVKNHRAPTEVRDAVNVLAKELDATAAKLEKAAPQVAGLPGEAAVQAHLALLEAKDKLALLEDVLRRALHGAASSSTFIGDTARLKLALARMDAVDLFEEKRRQWHTERRRIESITASAVRDLDERLEALSGALAP